MKKLFIGLDDKQLIKEDPDSIIVDNKSYWWFQKNAIPFMILSDRNDNSALIYSEEQINHKKMLSTIFNTLMFYKTTLASLIENNTLEEYALGAIVNPNTDLPQIKYKEIGNLIGDYGRDDYDDSLIFGRVWSLPDKGNYISIWDDPEKTIPYKQMLINFLQTIDINPVDSKWEIRGRTGRHNDINDFNDKKDFKFVSIEEFFNDITKQKPNIKPPHTIAGLGKALGIEAPGFGSYKQGEIASKVKMPFVQYHAMVNQESVEHEL